jgi:hypothetical protein
VFAADAGGQGVAGAVYAYLDSGKNQSPVWKLSAGLKTPSALWVDGSGDLYVGDSAGYVYEYTTPTASGPPSSPAKTYDNDGLAVKYLAACGDYLYASDVAPWWAQGAPFTIWKLNHEKPRKVVLSYWSGVPSALGMTCDSRYGDLYFAYEKTSFGPTALVDYLADGTHPQRLSPSPAFVAGLTFNQNSTSLVLGDISNPAGSAIEFWTPTDSKPFQQFTNPPDAWIDDPFAFAYEKGDLELWDADAGSQSLNRFKPGNGTLENAISSTGNGKGFTTLSGVAVSPADHP